MLKDYREAVASIDSPDYEATGIHEPWAAWKHEAERDRHDAWFKDKHVREDAKTLRDEISQFSNVYLFHNPAMFLTDTTRDALLKYYVSNRARRGFVHHMTAKAVRTIRGLSLKPDSSDAHSTSDRESMSSRSSFSDDSEGDEKDQDRGINLLRSLLKDTMQYVNLEKGSNKTDVEHATLSSPISVDPTLGIRTDFEIDKSTSVLFLKPQIVLRSEVDESSCIILSALWTRLSNYLVRDPSVILDDDINEKVLNRNFLAFDKVEAWYPGKVDKFDSVTLPLEVMLDDTNRHAEYRRVLPSTNVVIQYDKFNKLRLHDSSHNCASYSDNFPTSQEHLLHNMDLVRVQCPRFSVFADSEEYAALYNIATSLILYRDPAYREHHKRLETMLFAYNFKDPQSMGDVVAAMQVRIRQAEDLHQQYERHIGELTVEGVQDAISAYREVLSLRQELSLFMEAISAAQDRAVGADKDKKSALRFEASAEDVCWHMTANDGQPPLAELQIKGTSFTWLNKADNSTANTLSIIDLQAVNNRPDALFRQIISKYTRAHDHFMVKQGRFLNAAWSVVARSAALRSSIVSRSTCILFASRSRSRSVARS